ncbi:hypothetical protein HDU96_002950, partial [Phlyctochytrium bullatum]
ETPVTNQRGFNDNRRPFLSSSPPLPPPPPVSRGKEDRPGSVASSTHSDVPFATRGTYPRPDHHHVYPPAPSDNLAPNFNPTAGVGASTANSNYAKNSVSLGRKKSLIRPERRPSGDGVTPTMRRRLRNNLAAAELVRETRHDSLFRSIKRKAKEDGPRVTWWVVMSRILTFYLPNFVIHKLGKRDPYVAQAFREKIALCTISFFLMLIVGFLTFGFQNAVCQFRNNVFQHADLKAQMFVGIRGSAWAVNDGAAHPTAAINLVKYKGGDATNLFRPVKGQSSCDVLPTFPELECYALDLNKKRIVENTTVNACHNTATSNYNSPNFFSKLLTYKGDLTFSWDDVKSDQYKDSVMVYNGHVLNVSMIVSNGVVNPQFASIRDIILANLGEDATRAFVVRGKQREAQCLVELFKFATLDFTSSGCLTATVVLYVSFTIIVGVVLARFVLALYFIYVIGWRLGNNKAYARAMEDLRKRRAAEEGARRAAGRGDGGVNGSGGSSSGGDGESVAGTNTVDIPLEGVNNMRIKGKLGDPRFARGGAGALALQQRKEIEVQNNDWAYNFGFMDMESPPIDPETEKLLNDPTLMHVLVMVPCYSEGEESLKATLSSVAQSYYPSTHKCLFVVADGIVKGSENTQTTPDILIDMIEVDERFRHEDPRWGGEPAAYSYVAIADGNKRKNYARVYAGWYRYDLEAPEGAGKRKGGKSGGSSQATLTNGEEEAGGAYAKTLRQRTEGRVPMLLVVKVGNEEERDPETRAAKPGNRGKRDSQIILMNFLSKVMFDDRMTELEFDIFFKLFTITGVNPERYEGVLMVDADTRIYPDSLTHMVACLLRDHRVMGLCGETKILNKWESWVTMIQVFEYFISHHLAKSFESVFGGVTCLPGCFCMYRIKTPKGPNGHWVPILANPDIVEEYSENVVDTLHKKNLLLLGEDRFLSTMMLRNFPKRRMVFVPPAICKTVVPNTFKVLLSQRRRWINSTIHNLMELVLVKDLCGTFCISMQFVIFMELIGTVVLPAAITFTLILIFMSILRVGDTFLPLILLAIILGLPAVLIVMTANRLIYVFWMFVYLLSLPIWNFILPLYAFWHFDDFSWGETRKVLGEAKGTDHGQREGEFDATGISMKRWREWIKFRKAEAEAEAERTNPRRTITAGPNGMGPRINTMSSVSSSSMLQGGAPPMPMPPFGFAAPPPPPPGAFPPLGLAHPPPGFPPMPPPPGMGPIPLPPGVMPPPGMMAPPPNMFPPPPGTMSSYPNMPAMAPPPPVMGPNGAGRMGSNGSERGPGSPVVSSPGNDRRHGGY